MATQGMDMVAGQGRRGAVSGRWGRLMGMALGLLGLVGLGGCDDGGEAPACVALGVELAVGAAVTDPDTGTQCTCLPGGVLDCRTLEDRRRSDAGRPADGAVRDAAPDAIPLPDGSLDAGLTCAAGEVRCLDDSQLLVCDDAGVPTVRLCVGSQRCVGDQCMDPDCSPGALVCRRGVRFLCAGDGFAGERRPCPAGTVCAEGGCVDPAPDVLLVVDSSASMTLTNGPFGGESACDPPDTLPTRMGRVKQAMTAMLGLPELQALRLGLMRFPQAPRLHHDCPGGHYVIEREWPMVGTEAQSLSGFALANFLPRALAVPLPLDGEDNREALAAWVDHTETFEVIEGVCPDACPGLCDGDRCLGHTQPELRPMGDTPLGRTLFLAAEYLRAVTLREGLACGVDADCGSSHYACLEGRCHDPLGPCRGRVVLVLSDGEEGEDVNAETSFFAPTVQAKRMRFGLACAGPEDCLGGSWCHAGQCVLGECVDNRRITCRAPEECPGPRGCRPIALSTVPVDGPWSLRHPDGTPAPVTVHVIDAAPGGQSAEIARWGGGAYVPVASFTPERLLALLLPLFADAKDQVLTCVEQR